MRHSVPISLRCAAILVGLLLVSLSATAEETAQERVHRMSHHVMPFDMASTLHVFKMTGSGGIERVVARDAHDSEQIRLVRQHLRHEAAKFQQGDYSDPARLHGAAMPGLKTLQASAAQVRVTYKELADGAQITFETSDPRALTAIHRWFGAQLSEHGADARAE